MIGSPNFGHRSQERDLEAQVTLVTRCAALRRALHREQRALFAPSDLVTEGTFHRPERFVPYWVRTVVALYRNFF